MLESHGEALGEEEAFLRLLMRVNYRSANVSAPSGKGVVMVAKQRKGQTGTTTCRDIDKLTMAYAGNQLVKAEDSGTTVSLSSSMDFKNNSNATREYSYDANGNLTQDLNKGISSITYNLLNLPQTLSISNSLGSATNSYTYAADGRKLKAVIGSKTTEYCGNVIYENGVLKRILVDGGYIEGGAYYFYLTDHLGNNRVVANASGSIVQTNHYYPFGMSFAEGTVTSSQPYKYNGKELDTDRGLNLYDYSARYMDPALGRFNTVDPMAEKYYSVSPYVYCLNNPIKFIDPTGKDVWEIDANGNVINRKKDKTQDAFYRVDSDGKRMEGEGTSITFKYGTIKSQKEVTINVLDAEGNINKENITIFDVKGDENASNLFNFMINQEINNVEWGHVQTGSAKSEQNLIGTMHEENSSGMGSYALGYGYTIRQSDHNHPAGSTTPSEADVNNAKAISDKFPKAQFNIYGLPSQPVPYNKKSSYVKPAYSGAFHGKKQPGKTW